MPDNIFLDQSILITGASSGIGHALALQLASQGARLTLAARQADKLEQLAAQCRVLGGKAVAVPTDVTDREQCAAFVRTAVKTYGKIDVLINNAGVTMWALFEETTDLDVFDKIMQTNYLGSVYCTSFALPYLRQSKGRLVAISSLAGKAGVPTRTGYAASKHAMVGFFDSLRVELMGSGVSVTLVYPGFVDTGVQARGFGPDGKPLGKIPLQMDKIMTTEECARLTIKAMTARKREEVMTLRGKLGQWFKLIAPTLVDRIALKAIREGK